MIQGTHEERPSPSSVIWAFLYLWLMVGFFTGTAVLVGPAGWISTGLARLGVAEGIQNHALKGVILLFVVGSFFLARMLVRRMFRTRERRTRVGIPAFATILAGLALWAWSNPARLLAKAAGGKVGTVELASGASFLFGPYPDRARIAELKQQGVVALVSLQHPGVPVEVPGIAEERRAAAELGLDFIHAPMLPWISENEASLAKVRELVESGRGKYYVHCGLGRDRISVVRRLVESMGVRSAASADLKSALTFSDRKGQAVRGEVPTEAFERGPIAELAPGIWLIPHPNQSELFGYMLAGQVSQVISVLDPADPEERQWLAEQERVFAQYRVPFLHKPLRAGDSAAAAGIAATARRAPRPLAIIAPRTPSAGAGSSAGSEVAATIAAAFKREAAAAP